MSAFGGVSELAKPSSNPRKEPALLGLQQEPTLLRLQQEKSCPCGVKIAKKKKKKRKVSEKESPDGKDISILEKDLPKESTP